MWSRRKIPDFAEEFRANFMVSEHSPEWFFSGKIKGHTFEGQVAQRNDVYEGWRLGKSSIVQLLVRRDHDSKTLFLWHQGPRKAAEDAHTKEIVKFLTDVLERCKRDQEQRLLEKTAQKERENLEVTWQERLRKSLSALTQSRTNRIDRDR